MPGDEGVVGAVDWVAVILAKCISRPAWSDILVVHSFRLAYPDTSMALK